MVMFVSGFLFVCLFLFWMLVGANLMGGSVGWDWVFSLRMDRRSLMGLYRSEGSGSLSPRSILVAEESLISQCLMEHSYSFAVPDSVRAHSWGMHGTGFSLSLYLKK